MVFFRSYKVNSNESYYWSIWHSNCFRYAFILLFSLHLGNVGLNLVVCVKLRSYQCAMCVCTRVCGGQVLGLVAAIY
jgi:hypothetical protein